MLHLDCAKAKGLTLTSALNAFLLFEGGKYALFYLESTFQPQYNGSVATLLGTPAHSNLFSHNMCFYESQFLVLLEMCKYNYMFITEVIFKGGVALGFIMSCVSKVLTASSM